MIYRFLTKCMMLSLVLTSLFAAAPLFATQTSALSGTTYVASFKGEACSGVSDAGGGGSCGENGDEFLGIFKTIINILSIIIGIVAVVMVIVSGFRYITSGGDSNKTASAKNTLIYALIGLALAALAKVIVEFVLQNAK